LKALGERVVDVSALSSPLLKEVKLTKSADNGRRWEVAFKDAKRTYECTPDFESLSKFELKGSGGKVVLTGNVVDANTEGVVLKVGDLFYKMRMGQTIDDALNPPRDADKKVRDPEREPLKEYT